MPSFLGRMKVPLRYNLFPFLARKGAMGMVERVFQHPVRGPARGFPCRVPDSTRKYQELAAEVPQ